MSKAYVLLSGGIDSSTALAIALQQHGTVTAVVFNYGQRHIVEVNCAIKVASHFGIEVKICNAYSVMSIGGLTDPDLKVPQVPYDELPAGVSPTYVPFRNGIFLSIAAGYASADPEATHLYYGAHAEDAENDAYPDCSVGFIVGMQRAINIGTYDKIQLVAPFVAMRKHEIIKMGEYLKVPWGLTWSCYEGGKVHCATCSTCRARREAFRLANVTDGTVYATSP